MRLWLTLVLWLGSSLVLTEESPPPSKRHKCPDTAQSKHLLCYHEGKISSRVLDPCVCTHMVLPAIEMPEGYQLDHDKVPSSVLSDLRGNNPTLRLLLGVDATSRALHSASDKKVSDFARATADYIKNANLDGLEVNLGDTSDESTHNRRKENVVSVFKSLREGLGDAKPTESDGGQDSIILLRLPVNPSSLAKTFDLKPLSKYVDYFTVSTHNITDSSEKDVTYHHSRLMGLADILNTDSVLDLLTGMGAPPSKMIISLPTHALLFTLKNENENVARSPVAGAPKVINYEQVCSMMKEGGWTVERDEDLTAPYAFRNKTWIAFDDETSTTIKGKYALLRGLAGVAVSSIDADDRAGVCGRGSFPLTRVLKETLTTLSRKPRGLILRSLEEELRGGVAVALPEASLDASVRLSPFRIVRVVDREGAVHVIRRDSETRFECSRQGYFRHPLGCNQFYRCVKFDQLSNDFSVFEYDCPPGLAFDEKWEVCVWPGQMSVPCEGSSEIAPVPKARFVCPAEGYYADPENCRWFFACLDHHGDPSVSGRDATDPHSGLTAYEFRCPFGLAFDGSRLACEWPWAVPGCGKVEIGSGVLAAIQPARVGYSLIGGGGAIGSPLGSAIGSGGAIHHVSHVEGGSVASIFNAGDARGAHIATGGAHISSGEARLHHVSNIESGSVSSIFNTGNSGAAHIVTGSAQLPLSGARFASGGSGYASGGSHFLSGGAQLSSVSGHTASGVVHIQPVAQVESGSVASVFGARGSEGAHIASGGALGGAHLTLGQENIDLGGSLVSSGGARGSFISSGGARGVHFTSEGARGTLISSSNAGDSLISSGGLGISAGGAEIASGVAQTVSGGEKIIHSYPYPAPVSKYESSIPIEGIAYTTGSPIPVGGVSYTAGHSIPAGGVSFRTGSSIITGTRAGPARIQPLKTVNVLGVSGIGGERYEGVGESGIGHGGIGIGGVEVSGVGVSGIGLSGVRVGGAGIGVHAIPSVAPSVVGVTRESPAPSVLHTGFDDASKYTVSVSTPSTTSRPVTLVNTNVFSTATPLVTPAPIQYQSPQAVFLSHENYQGSVPATSSGTSSFSVPSGIRTDGSFGSGSAFGSRHSIDSVSPATPSGGSSYSLRKQSGYQSGSFEPQFYFSSSGPLGSTSYSLQSSAQRNGAFVPVKPLAGSTVVTASERPILKEISSPAFEAARASLAAGAEGGSVGGAFAHDTLSSSDIDAATRNAHGSLSFGLVRDDGHAVTGDISSRPNLVGVNYQQRLAPTVTAPAVDFSYKELPATLYENAPAQSFEVTGGAALLHQAPQRVFNTENVSPGPIVTDNRIHHSTIITQSTTPAYDEVNVGINGQDVTSGGFSYKNILPVVELSTPAPNIVSVPKYSIHNQGNPTRKSYHPVFTTTVAPPTSISLDNADYGSRLLFNEQGKQPVAFTSSRGTSGLLQLVQTESPSVSYSPSLVKTRPIQQFHNIPITSEPAVYVSTTPAPSVASVSYQTTPSTPISSESPVYYVPSRGPTRQRYFSTTTAVPIIPQVFSGNQDFGPGVTLFESNRVSQNIPVTSTFAPLIVTSVLPLNQGFNGSDYRGRGVPTYRQPILRGHDETSSSDSDNEEPVSVTADVRANYGDRPSKRVRVDVLLKKDEEEPHVSIETDSGKIGRGRYRYRARGGSVRVNGKKKCDDEEDVSNRDPNVDAILNGYSGNFGSILSNGDKESFIQGVLSDDLRRKSVDVGVPVIGSSGVYNKNIFRGDQGPDKQEFGLLRGNIQQPSNPDLTLGVTVKSGLGLEKTNSRSRGRYQNENANYRSNYKTSTLQPTDYSLRSRNAYVVSTVPTVVPVFTSTPSYVDDVNYQTSGGNVDIGYVDGGIDAKLSSGIAGGSITSGSSQRLFAGRQRSGGRTGGAIREKSSSGISELYTGSSRKTIESESGTDSSSLDINHAAVIILPCGKLPALLAKLGAVTEGLKSIQEEESRNTALRITGEQTKPTLSLPPLNRYGPGGWNAIEKTLGNDACQRAGLFRHPQDCNRFYECYWDEWKGRYSLHEFKCPIRLAYDDSLSACNWPTSGPACSANKLLV